MSHISSAVTSRSTFLASSDTLLGSMNRTQLALFKLQQQISTGRQIDKPSDAPERTSTVLALESQISDRIQHEQNSQYASGLLDNTDKALGDVTNILRDAQGVAMNMLQQRDSKERAAQATIVDGQLQGLMALGNLQYQGVSLFGGESSVAAQQPVFVEFLGGVRYVGANSNLTGDVGGLTPLEINSNGQEAFGVYSSRVKSRVDLDPLATGITRISDVRGAPGQGVQLGSVEVMVDTTVIPVDLLSADNLGDVVTRIQHAIDSVDPTAGTFDISGNGFQLTANTGHLISISDINSGQTAADLGIIMNSAGGTASVGQDLGSHLTTRSELSTLGTAIDFESGLKISQGMVTKVVEFSSAMTIEDMINEVTRSDLGLRLEINETQTGLNLISEVSGLELSIGENAGGTTASDLGLRTFGYDTALNDFRFGLGIEPEKDKDDFAIALHNGRSFQVNIDGSANVSDVLNVMRDSAVRAGLTVGVLGDIGTDINIGLALDGNGFQFEDGTVGVNNFRIMNLGTSLVARQLGIEAGAGLGNQIIGEDMAKVQVEGAFTHLINLRDGLGNNDEFGMGIALDGILDDIENTIIAHANVGIRAQQVQLQQERSQELRIAELQLLSEIQDTDLTEAVTRLVQLQQQLQATLQIGSSNMSLTLLDFLR
ncbi:MAG: hypothetical protein CMJ20_02115 [Phycisphaeraceae bacterium]|nr:hypothetical protein [Phycisphaeraceae bacterium]